MKNPKILNSAGFLKNEVMASMEFSNKKDKEFFSNSKTIIQKPPVTDFTGITKKTANQFYFFTKELFTTERNHQKGS